jgi:hypothetical protein
MEQKNTSSSSPDPNLSWEQIYSTAGDWRAPYIRTTENLPDGSPGWSVFLGDGRVLNTNMAGIRPEHLSKALEFRKHEIVHSLPVARCLLINYLHAGKQLKQRADKEKVQQLVKELSKGSFFKIAEDPRTKNEERQLSQLLAEFGMLVPLFACIKDKLPLACPDATVFCDIDDDDEAPTICQLIITVPSKAAEQYDTVSKLLKRTLKPLQNAINLACSTDLLFFSADIKQT